MDKVATNNKIVFGEHFSLGKRRARSCHSADAIAPENAHVINKPVRW
jgi:hypothetical protein